MVTRVNIFHLSFQGAGFAAFGQAKPVVTPFGQVAAVGVSINPFMVSCCMILITSVFWRGLICNT